MADDKKPWEQNLEPEDEKKPWEQNLSADDGVKKKVDTIPSRSRSDGVISSSTTGGLEQPIPTISDYAPKEVKPTPFVGGVPQVQPKKTGIDQAEVRKIKAIDVDKDLLAQKLNENLANLNKQIEEDNSMYEQAVQTRDELSQQLNQLAQEYNAAPTDADKSVLEQRANETLTALNEVESEANRLSDKINKSNQVAARVGRITETTKKVAQYDQEIQRLKGRLDGTGTRDIFLKSFWNATIPSLVSGAGSTIEAFGDIDPRLQGVYQINQFLPEDKKIFNLTKVVGESMQDFSDKITAKNPEYAQKSMFSDDFNIESAVNLAGGALGSLASIIVPTGAVGAIGKGSQAAIKLTKYGTSLALGMDEAYGAAKQAGLNDRDAAILSFSIALPIMALDGAGAEQFVSKLITPNIMKNTAKEAAKQLGKEEVDKVIFDTGKQVLLKEFAKSGVKEGATEAVQSLVSSTGQELYDVSQGGEFMSEQGAFKNTEKSAVLNALEEGIVGGLVGGVVGSTLTQNKSIYDKVVEINQNPQELEAFQKQLDREVKLGNISTEEAQRTLDAMDAIDVIEQTIPPTIKNNESRLAAVNIIAEKNALNQMIEGKEKALVQPEMDRIKALDEGLKMIALGNKIEDVEAFLAPTQEAANNALGEEITNIEPINTQENAIQEQTTDEGVLREERPEMGLQAVEQGDTQQEIITPKGQEVQQEEIAPTEANIPVTPIPETAEIKPEKEQKESQFYQSVKAQMIDPEQNKKLSEVPNPMYEVIGNKETMDGVNSLIANNTVENLESIVLSDERVKEEGISENERVVTMAKLADSLLSESISLAASDPKTSNSLFERSQKLYSEASQVLTKAGRTVQAASMILYGYGNFQSAVMQFRKKVDKVNLKNKAKIKEAAKTDIDGIKQDVDIAINEALEGVKKRYASKKSKSIEEIRAKRVRLKEKYKKNSRGLFNSTVTGLSKEGIEYAGELAITYIEEGIVRAKDIIAKIKEDFKELGYDLTSEDEGTITSRISKIALEDKIKALGETLTQITKQHYTTQKEKGKNLAQKIVDELGLTDAEANKIAKEIEKEFEARITDKLNKRFGKQLKTAKEKKDEGLQEKLKEKREIQKEQRGSDIDILLQAVKDGKVNESLMSDLFAEKYGIVNITPEDLAYINEQYEKIAKIKDPTSFIATEFYANIFNRINSKLPKNLISTLDQLWYSSVLSGVGTTDVNISFGILSTTGAAIDGFWTNIIRYAKNPKNAALITQLYLGSIAQGLYGMNAGQQKGRYIIANGTSSLVEGMSQLETAAQNEADFKHLMPKSKLLANILDASKYPLRFLSAQDAFFNEVLKSSRVFPFVYEKYVNEGYKGEELVKRVTDEVRITAKQIETAEKTALEEVKLKYPNMSDKDIVKTISYKRRVRDIINSRLSKQAVDAATKLSKNYVLTSDPDGFAGWVYKSISSFNNYVRSAGENSDSKAAKYGAFVATKIIPFIKVPLNIVNLGVDYSPLGFTKAATGRALIIGTPREFSLGQKEMYISRAITGTLVTSLIMAANVDDLFGDGLEGGDEEENKKQKAKLQKEYKEKYGEDLPLNHPILMIPHEGQISGSLSMLTPSQRDFLTKNDLAKEYAVYMNGKWISTNNVAAWASLGFVGSLVNYNRYITNNKYVETETAAKKQDFSNKMIYLMFGLAGQLLEMGSLKGTQSLVQNLDYKNGDLPTKAGELLKTTLLQPLNIGNPAIIRQTQKYFDGVSRYQPTLSRDLDKFILQNIPLVGSIFFKGEKRHDSFGRDIKAFPGEGKGFLGTALMYLAGNLPDDKEASKVLDIMYMSGIKNIPNLRKLTLFDENNKIVQMDFKEWNDMDKMAKQMAFEYLKKATSGEKEMIEWKIVKNGKIQGTGQEYEVVDLIGLSNALTPEQLGKRDNLVSKQIRKVYNMFYNAVYDDYMERKGLSKQRNAIPIELGD